MSLRVRRTFLGMRSNDHVGLDFFIPFHTCSHLFSNFLQLSPTFSDHLRPSPIFSDLLRRSPTFLYLPLPSSTFSNLPNLLRTDPGDPGTPPGNPGTPRNSTKQWIQVIASKTKQKVATGQTTPRRPSEIPGAWPCPGARAPSCEVALDTSGLSLLFPTFSNCLYLYHTFVFTLSLTFSDFL